MVYRVSYTDCIVEFVRNKGRAFLEAPGATQAIARVNEAFDDTRNEFARDLGSGQYLVTFQVGLGYKKPLLKQIERAVKLLRNRFKYDRARYVDRYAVALIYGETGQPDYLRGLDVSNEVNRLREAAVVAREINNAVAFIDLDIAVFNYIELNCKPGHRSKVIRGGK